MASGVTAGAVLELAGIEKSFGANPVLRGVDLRVGRGEVHALLGENGAGKSTLMRIVLGVETADRGEMTLCEQSYRPRSPRSARDRGAVMVPQERTLCLDLTVLENVVLGIEPTAFGIVRRRDSRTIAEHALALVTGSDRTMALDARARDLSVADQQLVEIARALAQGGATTEAGGARARLLVLDEPTASLGQKDAAMLFERVHALKAHGLGIILVTHFLRDVQAHADRYTVLRDGKVAGHGEAKTAAPERIVREMLGRELEAELANEAATGAPLTTDVLLDARDLAGLARPTSASLTLRRGEVLGIAGLVGSGRTELLRLIAGLDRRARGSLTLSAPKGVGLLSEDRGGEGLMLRRSIAENVMLSKRGPFVSLPRRLDAEATRYMSELAVRSWGAAQPVGELSGGNQQKVQLLRLVREDYDVLLVDEPTRGIDVASKAQVLSLLRELAKKGKGVVLVSSQLDELVSTCDRIAVLKGGQLGPARPSVDWTEESLLLEASS